VNKCFHFLFLDAIFLVQSFFEYLCFVQIYFKSVYFQTLLLFGQFFQTIFHSVSIAVDPLSFTFILLGMIVLLMLFWYDLAFVVFIVKLVETLNGSVNELNKLDF